MIKNLLRNSKQITCASLAAIKSATDVQITELKMQWYSKSSEGTVQ